MQYVEQAYLVYTLDSSTHFIPTIDIIREPRNDKIFLAVNNVLPPSQNDCPVICPPRIEAQSQIFSHQTFYIKKSFDTTTFGGISK